MGKTLISTSGLPGNTSGPKKTLITNINGKDGNPGEDAYQIAVENGFEGTEIEWLETLDGVDGKDAYEIALLEGFIGSRQEWLDFLKGEDGLSAYLVAVEEGFEGDQDLWLSTLEGQDGDDGYTPYLSRTDTHIQVIYVRDEEATPPQNLFSLDSVRGLPGKSAYQSAVDSGFSGTEAQWVAQLKGKDAVFPNTQGSATTVPYGQPAELTTSIDPESGLLLFSAKIPAGKDGVSPAQPVPSVIIRDAADGAPGSGTVSGTYPNWSFEFFLRRGLPGAQGTSGGVDTKLSGRGVPNGKDVASIGAFYVDLDSTLGAQIWYKASGTGNTGWVVFKGDTHWRNITSLATNFNTATNPGPLLLIRRINERVYIFARGRIDNASMAVTLSERGYAPPNALPVGEAWRSTERTIQNQLNVRMNWQQSCNIGSFYHSEGTTLRPLRLDYEAGIDGQGLAGTAWVSGLPGTAFVEV